MKVCTDACLFGAYLATRPEAQTGRILDIGTGTGLLALMLAQQSPAQIHAVELEPEAAAQAAENFQNSPWSQRLQVFDTAVQSFASRQTGTYPLIVCNPPFYAKDLKSPDPRRNLAHHSAALTLDELFGIIVKLLSPGGHCALLLPFARRSETIARAKAHALHCRADVQVHQTERHGAFRSILLFSEYEGPCETEAIYIREGAFYSPRFAELLEPYYLQITPYTR